MFWLAKFFTKGKTVKDAIAYFFKLNNRMPNNIEIIKIKNAFMSQNRPSNVIDITSRIKDEWWKKRPGESISSIQKEVSERTGKVYDPKTDMYVTPGKKDLSIKERMNKITGMSDELKKMQADKEALFPGSRKKVEKEADTYLDLLDRQSKETATITPEKYPGMSWYSEMRKNLTKHRREELEFKYDEMFNKILEKAKRIEADPHVLLEAELGTKLKGDETTTQLLEFFKNRPKKASGGIARVGMFGGGPIVKGGKWFIKNLRQAYDELISGKSFNHLQEWEKEGLKWEILAQIKQIERGGPIHKDMLEHMSKDKRFKDMMKTRSTDPELYEVEEVLLDRQAGKQSDELFDAEGKLNKKAVLKEVRDSEEKMILEEFDVTGRKKNASGGIAGQLHLNDGGRVSFTKGGKVSSGLAHVLGV